ncbi:MAG: hypothetical protein SRB2_02378 [Desulfobacteraceae bacterium Eth-SRB2]|nr:MAG: hypothetical protein SRB2_02378 [Desulfobacteraceae bacterium Eth-SRB2]
MGKLRDAKLIFDPTLFWDVEDTDTGCHADYIIARGLDFGDEKDVKRLREIYSDDELIKRHKDKEGAFADNETVLVCVFQYTVKGGRECFRKCSQKKLRI